MNSKSLKELEQVIWHPFKRSAEEKLMNVAPHLPGIYIIRCTRTLERLLGNTDIVYIGCATYGEGKNKRKGLNRRIYEYLHTTKQRQKRNTCFRIMKWIEKLDEFEIAFIPYDDDFEVTQRELFLLHMFENEHAELPPFNRQGCKN